MNHKKKFYSTWSFILLDCINPICDFCLEIETPINFYLHCPFFQSARQSFLINIKKIDESILKTCNDFSTKKLLHGNDKFDLSCHKSISSTIEFTVSSKRFSNSLVWTYIFKQSFIIEEHIMFYRS